MHSFDGSSYDGLGLAAVDTAAARTLALQVAIVPPPPHPPHPTPPPNGRRLHPSQHALAGHRPAHSRALLQMAVDAMVLLKNQNQTLPLHRAGDAPLLQVALLGKRHCKPWPTFASTHNC